MLYLVYCCHNETEVLYIGHGKSGREHHCNSGVSHVYELNKEHFLNRNLKVKILKYFSDKESAKNFEEEMIKKTLPKYNKSVKIKEKKDTSSWLDSINKDKASLDLFNLLTEKF